MVSMPVSGPKTVVLGVTGASGSVFARRMLQMLGSDERVGKIHLVVSGAGLKVLREELELDVSRSASLPAVLAGGPAPKTEYLLDSDIGAAIASGSYRVDGMVIIPCSTGCLAQIAHGISSTLIERAADVCLKEGRTLILAVRDTPLSRVHLRNMLHAQEAGAEIFPIVPAFYHRPTTIDDLVTQFCCRVLAHLGLDQNDQFRWKGEQAMKQDTGKKTP
ncbi:MAG TPA: UbiX family flavin prenyltransferase [Terriglobia bacterium]|nr:UbiX family flavin prenyltransferase [Terriglobia bacterium]